MKNAQSLILSILPLIAKASVQHHYARPLQLALTPPPSSSSHRFRTKPTTRHGRNTSFLSRYPHLHLTGATTETTLLQLLHRHPQPIISQHKLQYSPQLHPYPYRRQLAMSTHSIDQNDTIRIGRSNKNGMKILGICGGIGSGKSTACQLMVNKLGCAGLIDADKLAHVVYEPGSLALKEIIHEFGDDILLSNDSDDSEKKWMIDRKKLGAIVFQDPKSMSKLERIVWPHVRTKIEEGIQEIILRHQNNNQSPTVKCTTNDVDSNENITNTSSPTNNVIIVEAALLLETDWHDLLDGLWVIHSSEGVATSRLIQNRGMTKDDALLRIRAQQKRKGIIGANNGNDGEESGLRKAMENGIVTAIITNDGSLDTLETTLKETLADPTSFKNIR